ncbi:DUF1580 domain-containing protein [Lacipirellula limnantheis]|uniref:Uncharacterized protein n=1 Tax=Lacipirellula limnantheis TaxID=2528024 RepID=A0A517U2I9_9BACT|nr:DUF1580 domain-containing protein [Lacipirellula limnantheis]QDT74837.1 hypothetical protein I41_40400 [Lacipirellula limnantheis]
MVDFLKERRLSLTELARQEGVSVPTPWRWSNRGVKGVVLETFSIGGRRYTTQEAFQRFVERSTAAATGVTAPGPRTNRQREAAIRKAEAELAKAGV